MQQRSHGLTTRSRTGHALAGAALIAAWAATPRVEAESPPSVAPAWLYPTTGAPAAPAAAADTAPQTVPGAERSYPAGELSDRYRAVDWRPGSHTPMPDVVARGRAPNVYACGYCHLPAGQGRPENASLAGLPADYIVRQVSDFRSGARRNGGPDGYVPTTAMIQVARELTEEELAAAAAYFAAQRPVPRVRVVEATRVPRAQQTNFVYIANPLGGTEPLGQRLLEYAPDLHRHERRDDQMIYVAYVPPGSLRRGRALVTAGAGGRVSACTGCHGAGLRGEGPAPALAGRSPSYLLRALYGFRNGARDTEHALPMLGVVTALDARDLIDAAAYLASLPP